MNHPSHRETAARLGWREEDVARYVFRAKHRFREILEDVVRDTVGGESDIRREIEDLRRYAG